MSIRVHSNIAPSLSRQFNLNAFGAGVAMPTTNPNNLAIPEGDGTKTGPSKLVAHGVARAAGVVSFLTEQANQAYTLWIWSEMVFKYTNGATGWVKNGALAAQYTMNADPYAKTSFTISEDDLFFIQAGTTACALLVLGGSAKYAGSPFEDVIQG